MPKIYSGGVIMKIKGLRLIKIGQTRGFLIPVQYMNERMDGGLKIDDVYDILVMKSVVQ